MEKGDKMHIALTRQVSPSIKHCELTHLTREPIDLQLARRQHRQYEQVLADLGCQVHSLPSEPDLPDSVFVEDAAVVLDELGVITLPGAVSRRAEVLSIAEALVPYREIRFIKSPGALDGGDVLRVGKTLYVGVSSRSNQAAVEQLRDLLKPFGYTLQAVSVSGCLHLKSAVTQVSQDTLLINRNWIDAELFGRMRFIDVHSTELYAANALMINHKVVYPTAYPKTRQRLESQGISVRAVDVSELIKAEGAVTCCSLIFRG
jgi:dimethylargininase